MCKASSSTQKSRAVKTRCRTPNQTPFSSFARGAGQRSRASCKLSQPSIVVIALVIFGVLPDLTGVASISPAHRKHSIDHLNKPDVESRPFLDKKFERTSGDNGYRFKTANNYSLALLPAEWRERKATSKEARSPWKSPFYPYFPLETKTTQIRIEIEKSKRLEEETVGKFTPLDVNSQFFLDYNGHDIVNGERLTTENKNKRILFGASTQKRDSNKLLRNDYEEKSDQNSLCPDCVGSSSLSSPLPAVTSSTIWTKLSTPPTFSAHIRSRRSFDSPSKFKEHLPRDVKFYNRNTKHLVNKIHHSSKKRRRGYSTPLLRHHGTKSAWWWNLMRQNRPASDDSISGISLPEREARSTYNGIGQNTHYSNRVFSPPTFSWSNTSMRGERSIEHETDTPQITIYSSRHRNECLLDHDMYNAKKNSFFDSTRDTLDSVVADNKLPEAETWVNEICCNAEQKRKGICQKEDKTLEDRVRKILKQGLKGICDDHLVCEIFSPQDLRNIGDPDSAKCRTAVKSWWRKFHRLFISIRNFEEIYQPKFDLFQSSEQSDFNITNSDAQTTTYNFTKCKEAYVYWACSTELPLWLRHQNGKVKNVSTCSNVCLEVEKSCPFHVKDRDLDTASGNPAFLCQDEEIPRFPDLAKANSNCCYSRMNWNPGKSVEYYKESEPFCIEPDQSSGLISQSSDGFLTSPKIKSMGRTHPFTRTVDNEYLRVSPSSSSNLSTFNSSKNNLSMPSSSSYHNTTLPNEAAKASRQNTQFETLPMNSHGSESAAIVSSSDIDFSLYSENFKQRPESFHRKSLNIKDGELIPHEMGNGLMTSEMIGYEETCDFILPQKKKEGKKAIFPFEVSPNSKHMYKKATNIIEDRFTTLSPPSTISTLSLRVPEEESVPEEMRYIKDGFNAIQGFIENLGRTNEELKEDAMMSNSGASLSQPIVIPSYHLISFHLLSRLQDWLQVYNKHSTSGQYMNLNHETVQQDSMDTTQERSYYFHHKYIKSISLAVLALSTFWWWYHSFWSGSFLADDENFIKRQPDRSLTYLHQTEVLKTRCKTSECVISAKKKVADRLKAKSTSYVINRNYQTREKLMYLDER